jgi:hypothetical protein
LHPDASSVTCSGGLVKSHSISRNALKEIAEDGHVIAFQGGYDGFLRRDGDVEPKPIGLSNASTFPAFCAKHDALTFSPIEQGQYAPCAEHAFLESYRAVCRELFWRQAGARMDILRELDRGLPLDGQLAFQSLAAAEADNTQRVLSGLLQLKALYDEALVARDFSKITFYAVEFDGPPDVMMTSLFAPFVDFRGKVIRDSDPRGTTNDHLILSLFASRSRGWFLLAWLGESCAGLAFANSLAEQSAEEMPHAIMRLVFSDFENVFFRPTWWRGLSDPDKAHLRQRFWNPANPFQPRRRDYLVDDGRRLVDWRVKAISGNLQ